MSMLLSSFARSAAAGGGASAISTSGTVAGDAIGGSNAEGDLTFGSDGGITKAIVGSTNNSSGPSAWLSPTGVGLGAAFWLRATVLSGSLTSGTTGSWLAMSSARTFVKGPSSSGTANCVLTIEIATDAAGASIVASGTWNVGYSHTGSAIGSPAMTDHAVGGDVSCNVKWNADGTLTIDPGTGAVVYSHEWMSGAGATAGDCSAYELVLTYVSGPNPTSGTANTGGATKSGAPYGTALNLGTQQSITLSAYTGLISGTGAGTLRFDAVIRPAGGGTTLASARFTISATVG